MECKKQDRIYLKRSYGLIVLFLAISFFQTGTAFAEKDPAKQTYVYKTVKGLDIKADVYRPKGHQVTPGIMLIHGGALVTGDRTGIRLNEVKRYLALGYTVVSIDYRLAPETKVSGIFEDVQDAYSWMRKKSAELRIDPDRIGVLGQSAGGYLALASGYILNPRPRVIVVFYGYGNAAGSWYTQPDPYYLKEVPLVSKADAEAQVGTVELTESPGGKQRGDKYYVYLRQQGLWTKEVTGLDPERDKDALSKFSPVENVTPEYPPTMLLQGDADTDVPFQESIDMNNALTQKKVSHVFVELHGKGHGFDRDLSDPEVAGAFSQAVDFLNAWLEPGQHGTK